MGNCCAAQKPSSTQLDKNKQLRPIQRSKDHSIKSIELDPDDNISMDVEQKREKRLDELGLFRTQSFLERKYTGRADNEQIIKSQVKHTLTKASAEVLREYKALDKNLGTGAFSNVYLFQSRENVKMRYAVKIMFKEDLNPDILALVNEEVHILAMLDHPNIVKYKESYEDDQNMFIVMEYLEESTELQKLIKKQEELMKDRLEDTLFPEAKVCKLMRMLLSGLHHIHGNNVVHRDLKAENCMIDNNGQLRIIDFGLSKMVAHEEDEQLILGTPYYMAPEVFEMQGRNEAYRQPLDCWSAGILMHLMLSGEYPFQKPDLDDKIRTQMVSCSGKRWRSVSPYAIDLIKQLLKKDPQQRFTAQQALGHHFFQDLRSKEVTQRSSQVLDQETVSKLSGYHASSKLEKAALNLLVRSQMERKGSDVIDEMQQKIDAMRCQFEKIDLDGSGCVDQEELAQAMIEVNLSVDQNSIRKIIAEIDYVGNGKINYTEFLAATLNLKENLTEEVLHRLFKRFDVDDTNFISKKNLIDVFKRLGRTQITEDEVTEMIRAHDIAKDGQVSFQEFKVIFQDKTSAVSPLTMVKQDSVFGPSLIPITPGIQNGKYNSDSDDSISGTGSKKVKGLNSNPLLEAPHRDAILEYGDEGSSINPN